MVDKDDFASQRERMVQNQIAGRGIRDERVLEAMRSIPRHAFVPREYRHLAYADGPLPIGAGQTISQPYIVARMSEALLEGGPLFNVLEVGTGCGYQAAILSRLVAQVFSIETVPALAREAALRLQRLGCANVEVRHGDGYRGWPERAPFDGIIVTAAAPKLPPALVDQLAPGGRLVIPLGPRGGDQDLVVIRREADGTLDRRSVLPVAFVPMVAGK